MAVAELIGAAVGVLLLVVVAYLLVGGTLAAAETVVSAQKDVTLLQESRLRTHITVDAPSSDGNTIRFNVTNTGDERIGDLPHMDVFSYNLTSMQYTHYIYDSAHMGTPGTWYVNSFENATVHANEFDPGVTIHSIAVLYPGDIPYRLQVITGNGVSTERTISS